MGEQDSGMMVVRAELCGRVAQLRQGCSRAPLRDVTADLNAIHRLASAYGLNPVARLIEGLERAMRTNPGPRATSLYLDRLDDAIGCASLDEAASEAILASVSVRGA